MLTFEEARDRVLLRLWIDCPAVRLAGDELVITDTLERPWGWVFFWSSQRCLTSGDARDQIAGNAPLIVNRFDGTLRSTGTARSIDYYLEQYEDELNLQRGGWQLHIDEPPDSFLFVSSRLRSLCDVSLAELRALKQRLPGLWRSGTRREIEALYQRVIASGLRASVLPPDEWPRTNGQ